MRHGLSVWGLAIGFLVAAGCGKSGPTTTDAGAASGSTAQSSSAGTASASAPVAMDDPKIAVAAFLEALRTGNDEAAMKLLTATARQKAIEAKRSPAPSASETARFELGNVKYVADDGAQVECTWIDLDETGKPHSDRATWVCRKETGGWRVAGVAANVFPGEPPLLLNFEDPAEMQQKQAWLRDEMARRAKQHDAKPANEKSSSEAQSQPKDAFRR